jgi:mannan endo-1,4-beta-mannosidase
MIVDWNFKPDNMKFNLPKRLISVSILYAAVCMNIMAIDPVTPNASPESKALLKYIYSISGKYTLSGQHNFPASGERNTLFAADYIGKTPVVWSQDFGFAAEGDKDSYLSRSAIIQEAIRQHAKGAIIALCWHAVPPTAEEPVTFQPLPGKDPAAPLASVQGRLTEKQFRDILTPGTDLYKQWLKQVDNIAKYLKQLQDAKVPVMWRPYHEMNGDWFWWGGRYEGKYTTAALYRQIFDRLVNYHKINNLIWVWSVDRPAQEGREFDKYYPGTKYLDILAIDIYGNDFNQKYYEGLLALSEGKPVTLGEVGNPPAPEILEKQPGWVYWVVWSGMVRGTSVADYEKHTNGSRALFFEDAAYLNGITEFRRSCGLEPVKLSRTADFSGEWRLNECESTFTRGNGSGNVPFKLVVIHKDNKLDIKSFTVSEWSDDDINDQSLTLDGKENMSTVFMNSPRVQVANWSPEKDTLTVNSKISVKFGNNSSEIKSREVWVTQKRGKKLVIIQTNDGFMGRDPGTSKLVYDRY